MEPDKAEWSLVALYITDRTVFETNTMIGSKEDDLVKLLFR